MTRSQLDRLKKILEEKLIELRPSFQKRDDIAIVRSPDMLDEIQQATARELATCNLERDAKVSRDVRAALARMDEGAYGTCLNCEEEIGMRRLHALPWAPLCIDCQERSDSARRGGMKVDDRYLADAA
jgi:DnaK suppressor protein